MFNVWGQGVTRITDRTWMEHVGHPIGGHQKSKMWFMRQVLLCNEQITQHAHK